MGDAMRDIYTRGIVSSDFVLVAGDLVSNVRIDDVVRVHKERRRANKDAIMTMVVKESGVRHRTRWVLFALGSTSQICDGDRVADLLRTDREANPRYLCSTKRRPSVCTTSPS